MKVIKNILSNKSVKYIHIFLLCCMLLVLALILTACNEYEASLMPGYPLEPKLSIPSTHQTISLSEGHSMVIMSDGSLWAWGNNYFGELGDGTMSNRNTPVQVGTDTDWASVSAGGGFTVALKINGSLWYWGASWSDVININLGPTAYRITTPVQIGTDTDWVSVATGSNRIVAVKADGSLWAWGVNWHGRLGDGTDTDRYAPVQIGTDMDWAVVAVSHTHTIALKTDGSLWAWGYNAAGQFGDGTTDDQYSPIRSIPIQAGMDTDWVSVSTGDHTVAIKADGSLWAWGSNQWGQLGDGTTTNRYIPVQIGTDTDWASAVTGGGYTLAIKNDGSLWAWGSNWEGQLGDGTTEHRTRPVQVGTDKDWINVAAGDRIIGIRADSSVWSWGWRGEGGWTEEGATLGLLGDGAAENRHSPVKIMEGVYVP